MEIKNSESCKKQCSVTNALNHSVTKSKKNTMHSIFSTIPNANDNTIAVKHKVKMMLDFYMKFVLLTVRELPQIIHLKLICIIKGPE